jgi:predicted nucleic-acid-binding protein
LLQDNLQQASEVRKYIELAESKKVVLKMTSEVIVEIEYVLRKVYQVSRRKISETLSHLLKSNIFDVEKIDILLDSLDAYADKKLDLVDLVLFYQAKEEKLSLLTFDKALQKLSAVAGSWSKENFEEFGKTQEDFSKIDPEDWK